MFHVTMSPAMSAATSTAPRRRADATLAVLALAATLVIASARPAGAQCTTTSSCMWPVGCGYSGSLTVPIVVAGPVELRNLVLADRPPCLPVLASGSFTIHSSFDVFVEVSLDGGATWAPKATPGIPATMTMNLSTPPGSNPLGFDAELLSLNISGGTLPLGMLVRESPTLASVGHTDETSLGGGQFRIDSFFDIFVELSLDGGQTWVPSNQPTRLLLGTGNPTAVRASTWGAVKAIYR
jgi:hypothetical protein